MRRTGGNRGQNNPDRHHEASFHKASPAPKRKFWSGQMKPNENHPSYTKIGLMVLYIFISSCTEVLQCFRAFVFQACCFHCCGGATSRINAPCVSLSTRMPKRAMAERSGVLTEA